MKEKISIYLSVTINSISLSWIKYIEPWCTFGGKQYLKNWGPQPQLRRLAKARQGRPGPWDGLPPLLPGLINTETRIYLNVMSSACTVRSRQQMMESIADEVQLHNKPVIWDEWKYSIC